MSKTSTVTKFINFSRFLSLRPPSPKHTFFCVLPSPQPLSYSKQKNQWSGCCGVFIPTFSFWQIVWMVLKQTFSMWICWVKSSTRFCVPVLTHFLHGLFTTLCTYCQHFLSGLKWNNQLCHTTYCEGKVSLCWPTWCFFLIHDIKADSVMRYKNWDQKSWLSKMYYEIKVSAESFRRSKQFT